MVLCDCEDVSERQPTARLIPFFQAIQQNTSVRDVTLSGILLSGQEAPSFLDNATSITSLTLINCGMDPNIVDRVQGTRDLAGALQRNSNIQTLILKRLNDTDLMIPILRTMVSNATVTSLLIHRHGAYSEEMALAIEHLLDGNRSIQQLELLLPFFEFTDEFSPIARGLIGSDTVTDIRIKHGTFTFDTACAILGDIIRRKTNLSSLLIENCLFEDGDRSAGTIGQALVETLRRPHSALRRLDLNVQLGSMYPMHRFTDFLTAVGQSQLERLSIGTIRTERELLALTRRIPPRRIPPMRIKELDVGVTHGNGEDVNERVLQAIKDNFSLRRVTGQRRTEVHPRARTDLFQDDADKSRLAFYSNRNGLLEKWRENPKLTSSTSVAGGITIGN